MLILDTIYGRCLQRFKQSTGNKKLNNSFETIAIIFITYLTLTVKLRKK